MDPPDTGARVPKTSLQLPGFDVLYRNQPVVAAALGLAEASSVAPLLVTAVAPTVRTVGAPGTVNEKMEPNAVPEALETIAQK